MASAVLPKAHSGDCFLVQDDKGSELELFSVYVPTNHVYVGDIFLLGKGDIIKPNLSVREGLGACCAALLALTSFAARQLDVGAQAAALHAEAGIHMYDINIAHSIDKAHGGACRDRGICGHGAPTIAQVTWTAAAVAAIACPASAAHGTIILPASESATLPPEAHCMRTNAALAHGVKYDQHRPKRQRLDTGIMNCITLPSPIKRAFGHKLMCFGQAQVWPSIARSLAY